MRKSSFSAWVYLLMVFAAGSALGVVSDRLYTAKSVIAKSKPSASEFRRRYIEDLRTRLSLDGKQVTGLSEILDNTDKRMQDLHERYRPEMTSIHQDQVEKVHGILTETQRAAYDKIRKERQRQREAEEKDKGKS
jgi:hypothetical protein